VLRMAFEPPAGRSPLRGDALRKQRLRAVDGFRALEVELALLSLQRCSQVLLDRDGGEPAATRETNFKHNEIECIENGDSEYQNQYAATEVAHRKRYGY
jgi:hypothetical protein